LLLFYAATALRRKSKDLAGSDTGTH
jgi:hypothetical protein